jgi:hypothetical protein
MIAIRVIVDGGEILAVLAAVTVLVLVAFAAGRAGR